MRSKSFGIPTFTRPLPSVQVSVERVGVRMQNLAKKDHDVALKSSQLVKKPTATLVHIQIQLPSLQLEHVSAVKRLAGPLANLLVDASRENVEERLRALLKAYPLPDPLGDAHLENYQAELIARRHYLQTIPCLTSKQVTETTRRYSRNKRKSADQLKSEGALFSIPAAGDRQVYPAFQLKNGKPRAVIATVLKRLRPHRTPWEIAQWFIAPNGWLDGDRPIDMLELENNTGPLLDAAKQEVSRNIG